MAETSSLREYQRELSERLRAADSGRAVSKLGVRIGGENWLVDLTDAAEVIPVPPITRVPLTHHWFKGVTNIRGNLYSVVDFPAFVGGAGAALNEQARLLIVNERFRMGSALLVDASLGLRNPKQLRPVDSNDDTRAWVRAQYVDVEGRPWKELDLAKLMQDPVFLGVGT